MRRSARSSTVQYVYEYVSPPHAHIECDDAVTPAGLVCGGPAGAARVLPVGAREWRRRRSDSPTSFRVVYVTAPDAGVAAQLAEAAVKGKACLDA